MHFADVDGTDPVTPGLRFRGHFRAHRLAHLMAGFQHLRQRHVAETANGRVADVGPQRAARVRVPEQISDRVADPHLIPDADSHGRAFFGVHGLAAQILLIEAQVEHMALSQHIDDEGA